MSFSYCIQLSDRMARWCAGRTAWTILNMLVTKLSPFFPSPAHLFVPWRVVMWPTAFTPGSGRSWKVIGRWRSVPTVGCDMGAYNYLDLNILILQVDCHFQNLYYYYYYDWWCHFYPEWAVIGSPAVGQTDKVWQRGQGQQVDPGMTKNGEQDRAEALVKTDKLGMDRCHQTTPTDGEEDWQRSYKTSI